MRAEKVRVEADPCNPARDEPRILPGSHAAVVSATATEQKFAGFLASGFDVIVDSLARLLRQLKPDGPTGLPLPHCGAIDRIPAWCDVLDPKCDDIATPQLAVDSRLNIVRSLVRPFAVRYGSTIHVLAAVVASGR